MKSTPCQQLVKVVTALCDDVATPLSALVKGLVRKGAWTELQELRVKPGDYSDAEDLFKASCVVDLLRKAQLKTSVNTKEAAVKTFWDCEVQNAKTNARLNRYLPELLVEEPGDSAMLSFIDDWRKEIKRVLKRLPDQLYPRFGGGSTYGDKGALTTIPDKLTGSPTLTQSAWSTCGYHWLDTAWGRYHSGPGELRLEFVRGNRFSTVPKDGLKDRGICIEPSFNLGYQLDCGDTIRTKLKTIGIDLKHGQAIHQAAAKQASMDGKRATIDLSNASDTICRVLPRLVLPNDWFELLDSLRSPMTLIEGKWVRLEKFSSMGNGFTFELETLIFVTLARCVARLQGESDHDVLCYGDDLIVPSGCAEKLCEALKFFGFTPNTNKTFLSGDFRESCGGDFFKGVPVRAHFLGELPNEPQHWISLANGIYRMGHSNPNCDDRWSYLRRAHQLCLDSLPSNIRRLTGPERLGDLVIREDDENLWRVFEKRYSTGDNFPKMLVRVVRTYSPVQNTIPWCHWKPEVQLASALYGLPSTDVAPKDDVSGYRESFAVLDGIGWLPEARIIR